MSLLLNANWEFGISELISALSTLFTFLAICTSLYLAQKSKTLKFKIIGRKINKIVLQSQQSQQIEILNTGHIKFTFSCIGYKVGKNYYYTYYTRGLKKLDETRVEKRGNTTNHISTDILILPTYIHEGDLLQVALFPADYNFDNESKNKKVYAFMIINGKIYKRYVGMKLSTFKDFIKDFDETSMYNDKKNSIEGKNIKNEYIR